MELVFHRRDMPALNVKENGIGLVMKNKGVFDMEKVKRKKKLDFKPLCNICFFEKGYPCYNKNCVRNKK